MRNRAIVSFLGLAANINLALAVMAAPALAAKLEGSGCASHAKSEKCLKTPEERQLQA